MVSRRAFIALSGAGLCLGLAPLARGRAAKALSATALVQPFLRIGTDNSVTVIAKHLDMGQGIWSGLASIVAEELDAAWSQVRVEGAPANQAVYKNLIFGQQTTGGSTSIANSWDQMRKAGATARAMLVEAAAARWHVEAAQITVSGGVVRDSAGHSATFGQLVDAAGALAVPAQVRLKDPGNYKYLGKEFSRLDASDKSHGKVIYGIDVQRPGQKVAMIARPPRFGATVRSFDDAAARKVKGVVDVARVPGGIAILANNTWACRQAIALLVVQWSEEGAETRSSDAIQQQFKTLAREGEMISCLARGAPAAAMGQATRVVEGQFEQPYLAHASMEPLSAVCTLSGDRCEIWGGIQNQTRDQAAAARILGIPLENVAIHTLYAGSSFGRRASFTSDWISELAHIVKATGGRYPVKLVWSREDDIKGGYYRPLSYQRMRAGLDSQGNIVALEQVVVVQSFLFGPPKPGAKGRPDPTAVDGTLGARYSVANVALDWVNPPSLVPVQMFRALSFNHTTFAKEVFMDELARVAGRDPLAYRLAHLSGQPRQAAVLKLAADKAGWGKPLAPGRALGIAVQESQGSYIAQVAEVSIVDHAPRVERVVCAIDCGFALNPDIVRSQMEGGIGFGLGVALYGKISLKDGAVEQSNFHDYPVLRMTDMPRSIEVHIVDSSAPPSGVGEPACVVIAAAVANAVFALTGKPVRTLPFSSNAV